MKDTSGEHGLLSGFAWLLVGALLAWCLGKWMTPLAVALELLVLAAATAIVRMACVFSVPAVTQVAPPSTLPPGPQPRDLQEQLVQEMGFRHMGDFSTALTPATTNLIRIYSDPDHECAVMLVDMYSGKDKTVVMEFSTGLLPSGGITTSNIANPSILAHRLESMRAHVPWKKDPADIFALHQAMCGIARVEGFACELLPVAGVAEKIMSQTRKDYEYQVEAGRLVRVAGDRYRFTWPQAVIVTPLFWFLMAYGSLFPWFRLPDSFFLNKTRRRLRRFKRISAH